MLLLQAQCTSPKHLDTALAFMEEMRSRNIQPNTHTYSSLLNVCVKAGQLNMALGVYNEVSTDLRHLCGGSTNTSCRMATCLLGQPLLGASSIAAVLPAYVGVFLPIFRAPPSPISPDAYGAGRCRGTVDPVYDLTVEAKMDFSVHVSWCVLRRCWQQGCSPTW